MVHRTFGIPVFGIPDERLYRPYG